MKLTKTDLAQIQDGRPQVVVSDAVAQYLLQIVKATRSHSAIAVGASTRAALDLKLASQAYAAINGQVAVMPDIVKKVAPAVLSHRLTLNADAEIVGVTAEACLSNILHQVPCP